MPPDQDYSDPFSPPLTLAGKTVVIAEDEGVPLLQYKRALTRAGLLVVGTARTGQEAIETVLQLRPDLVLTDINLHGDINGLEAAEQILSNYPVCIVVMSAYEVEEYKNRAEAIGVCCYLVKPITSEFLIPTLEKAYRDWHTPKVPEPK